MAKQTFRIQLVEGGEGVVAEGDPAYDICKEIRKKGFTNIVLPLATLASGELSEKLLEADMDDDETFERMAGYYEQATYVTSENSSCIHHYILNEPVPGEGDTGICKWCGNIREYERFKEILWSSDEARARSYALREWERRLTEEEDLIGIAHTRDDTYRDEKPTEA